MATASGTVDGEGSSSDDRTDQHRSALSGRPNTLKPGAVLQGRYRIQDVLGVGGMSTVYRARDLRFAGVERLCAIKEMFNLGDDQRVRQLRITNFQREAALLATLQHDAIPRIYDFFEHQGSIYLVIELIVGQDLESTLAQRGEPFPEQQLVQWCLELCDVLRFLHGQKPEPIIYRDLKPSNIMIRASSQLTLVDFGIARAFAPQQKGTMIGTEGYAPPEQYRGIADARGDIYALGATLHHLVTGSDPRSEVPFTFAQRPPRRFNSAISSEFEQLILRCCSYAPSDRYQSIAEVQQVLEQIQHEGVAGPVARPSSETGHRTHTGLPELPSAARTGPLAIDVKPTPNERLAWVMATGDEVRCSASQAGGAIYVGSYDGHVYAIDETDGAVRWRFPTKRGVVSRPLPSAELVVFGSEDGSVYAVTRQHGRQIWSFRTAGPVRSSPQSDDRGIVIGSDDGFLYRLDRSRGTVIWRYKTWGPIRSTPLLADRHVVFGSDDGYLYCIDRDSAQLTWRHSIGNGVSMMSSPVRAQDVVIVGAGDGVIRSFELRSGKLLWSHETKKPVIATPLVVDRSVFTGSADGYLYSLDTMSGKQNWAVRLCKQITSTAALDGESLYLGGITGAVYCVNRADGNVRWEFQTEKPVVVKPLVTSEHVIFGSLDTRIYAIFRESD